MITDLESKQAAQAEELDSVREERAGLLASLAMLQVLTAFMRSQMSRFPNNLARLRGDMRAPTVHFSVVHSSVKTFCT